MVFFKLNYVNSHKFDFERYFFNRNIINETFYNFQNFSEFSLKVRRWQFFLSNSETSSEFRFQLVMLRRQARVKFRFSKNFF